MPCAIVLFVDRPFADVDASLGLTAAAEILMSSDPPTEDIQVLVIRGFDLIPSTAIQRLADLKYRLIDASAVLASVKQTYGFANETRVWRGEPFHEACFLRWLVLEAYFGDTPILAMDSDLVWRVDPHHFLDRWSSGGSVLCFSSPCFAFIKDRSWYEAYRSGLQRLAEDADFGSDFGKDHYKGLYHDQALLQHLIRIGDLADDTANLVGHGFSEQYWMTANPLGIKPGKGGPRLTFEQTASGEFIGGRMAPFWHMQTRFARYLWAVRFFPLFTGRRDLRVPYEGRGDGKVDSTVLLLNYLHHHLQRGDISFHHPKHQRMTAYATRTGVYADFFNGDLARETFRETVWWRPGVWAQ